MPCRTRQRSSGLATGVKSGRTRPHRRRKHRRPHVGRQPPVPTAACPPGVGVGRTGRCGGYWWPTGPGGSAWPGRTRWGTRRSSAPGSALSLVWYTDSVATLPVRQPRQPNRNLTERPCHATRPRAGDVGALSRGAYHRPGRPCPDCHPPGPGQGPIAPTCPPLRNAVRAAAWAVRTRGPARGRAPVTGACGSLAGAGGPTKETRRRVVHRLTHPRNGQEAGVPSGSA